MDDLPKAEYYTEDVVDCPHCGAMQVAAVGYTMDCRCCQMEFKCVDPDYEDEEEQK